MKHRTWPGRMLAAALGLTLFGAGALAGEAMSAADSARLADIKRISEQKSASKEWWLLLQHINAMEPPRLWLDRPAWEPAVRELRWLCDPALKSALVNMTADKAADPSRRLAAVRSMRGSARLLTDADIEAMIASDPLADYILVDVIAVLAPDAQLSETMIQHILALFDGIDDLDASWRANVNIGVVNFAGQVLERNRLKENSDKEVRGTLTRFLYDRAKTEDSDMLHRIGAMLAVNRLPGAAQLFVKSLKLELAHPHGCRRINPTNIDNFLKMLAGIDMGYDRRLPDRIDPVKVRPGSPEARQWAQKWVDWFDEHGDDPRYRLPTEEEMKDLDSLPEVPMTPLQISRR